LALFAVTAIETRAQEAPRIVETTLAPETATVGDRLTLTIVVAHAPDVTVEGPGFEAGFGGLEIVDVPQPLVEGSGNEHTTTLTYTLAAFSTGTVEIPPLAVTYSSPVGDGTLRTAPQRVEVQSVLGPGDASLRPLKPQLDISEGAPSPLVPTLFVAMFAALTALGYALVRRAIDARPAVVAPLAPELSPYERARLDLDALAADGAGDPNSYYAGVAATVRRYLSARFGFPAYAMTRRELERGMARAGIDRWPSRVTANLLEQCDAVQFAGFRPPPERVEADLTAAYEIIELTRPPEPQAAPAN
jgi:hypothetical protein